MAVDAIQLRLAQRLLRVSLIHGPWDRKPRTAIGEWERHPDKHLEYLMLAHTALRAFLIVEGQTTRIASFYGLPQDEARSRAWHQHFDMEDEADAEMHKDGGDQ